MRRFLAMLLALIVSLNPLGPAMAASFVDLTLGDVRPEERVTVPDPKPVQLLVTFQTAGAANATATRFVKPIIVQHLTATGAFSTISDTPVEGGSVLQVTINNIGQADAANQGFVTGLTFGLRGSLVADTYEAKLEFVAGDGQPTVTKTATHRLITRIGNHPPPENAVRVRNIDAALDMILRQLVDRMVTDLTRDPAFGVVPAAQPEQLAPPPAPSPVTEPEATPVMPAVPAEPSDAPPTPAAPAEAPPAAPPAAPPPAAANQTAVMAVRWLSLLGQAA